MSKLVKLHIVELSFVRPLLTVGLDRKQHAIQIKSGPNYPGVRRLLGEGKHTCIRAVRLQNTYTLLMCNRHERTFVSTTECERAALCNRKRRTLSRHSILLQKPGSDRPFPRRRLD